jgi:aminomuconate-semialdehyde/2-hydroxymuconate-6-semialdehyde dehydrogenase
MDNGKPVKLATHVDIPRAVSNLKFFATAIQHYASESHYMEGLGVNYTLRKPIGIVGCISPWNLPLYLFTWKIAPALAAGNCVIAKPSEVTPMTAYMLSEVCKEAGLPDGVLNIIHGLGHKVGDAMTRHPKIKSYFIYRWNNNWTNNCRNRSTYVQKTFIRVRRKESEYHIC